MQAVQAVAPVLAAARPAQPHSQTPSKHGRPPLRPQRQVQPAARTARRRLETQRVPRRAECWPCRLAFRRAQPLPANAAEAAAQAAAAAAEAVAADKAEVVRTPGHLSRHSRRRRRGAARCCAARVTMRLPCAPPATAWRPAEEAWKPRAAQARQAPAAQAAQPRAQAQPQARVRAHLQPQEQGRPPVCGAAEQGSLGRRVRRRRRQRETTLRPVTTLRPSTATRPTLPRPAWSSRSAVTRRRVLQQLSPSRQRQPPRRRAAAAAAAAPPPHQWRCGCRLRRAQPCRAGHQPDPGRRGPRLFP